MPRKSIRNTSIAVRPDAISQALSALSAVPDPTREPISPAPSSMPQVPEFGWGRFPMAAAAAKQAPAPPPAGRRVPCEKCPLRDNPCLRDFTAKELAFVTEFKSGELNVEAGTNILLQ